MLNRIKKLPVFILYALLSSGGLIMLKAAMAHAAPGGLFALVFGYRFIAGGLLYVSGFLVWMYILSKHKLSVAYPVSSSLLFMLVALGGYLVFQEALTLRQLAGSVICLIGIFFLSA